MDFGNILDVAHQKQSSGAKKEVRYYKTKFEPPKKVVRSKELSANIKKYLARVEEEKKQKALEEKVKRDELTALRSQDKKAHKRVQVMLKSTKSANKSVLEDAVNNVNTAVTINGNEQPDEDDYGYVSQEADAYYKKMMEKYNAQPDDPKFLAGKKKNTNTNLGNTKDRVKAALEKEKEDALLPHKRKRKHRETETYEEEIEEERKPEVEVKKPKPKVQGPPPMDFNSLLKLAQVKQFEPVKIEPKKKDEEGPLMTKKQRREYEKEQAYRDRKAKGLPPPAAAPVEAKKPEMRIPKLNSSASKPTSTKTSSGMESKKTTYGGSGSANGKIPEKSSVVAKPERPPLPSSSKANRSAVSPTQKQQGPPPAPTRKTPSTPTGGASAAGDRPGRSGMTSRPSDDRFRRETAVRKGEGIGDGKASRPLNTMMLNGKNLSASRQQYAAPDVARRKPLPASGKQFPAGDVKRRPELMNARPKQFPPPDVARSFPPGDVRRKRPPPVNKRRILDDDDEDYDSEMDDFIDDGPEEGADYSKYISEIFGYDKRKYRYAEDDDDNMESSFAQQMREECISTKIGIMEDLEDMKLEKMEKMKKSKMKKSSN